MLKFVLSHLKTDCVGKFEKPLKRKYDETYISNKTYIVTVVFEVLSCKD